MWNEWIYSILPDLTGQRILELGHGPGHLQIALLKKGHKVTGIDLSPQMGQLGAKRIRTEDYPSKLVNSKSQQLPFPNNTFDQIVSTFPTEYIMAQETINELKRVLIPGGGFIILPVAWITGDNILHKAAAWLFKVTGQTGDSDKDLYKMGLNRYAQAGFDTDLEIRELKNSRVLILQGTKVAD
jgi:ubiquinone/menaquinone biosynthesis C-methylase UbiE